MPPPAPIPPVGGELRDVESTFDYDGPIGRLRISDGVLGIDDIRAALLRRTPGSQDA